MLNLKNNEETWEMMHLASGIYTVGEQYPSVEFPYYIESLSETNLYCSVNGVHKQIEQTKQLNPERKKIVYFYYKLNSLNGA